MIEKDLAREAIGMLGAAAAMLIEDAHPALVIVPRDRKAAAALATRLDRLGADLQALGTAAAVLSRDGPFSASSTQL